MSDKKTGRAKDDEAAFRIDRDLVRTARKLSKMEVRLIVDSYYQVQKYRIQSGNQVAAMTKSEEECLVSKWIKKTSAIQESQVKRVLKAFVQEHPIGTWLLEVVGIGEVIAAGLIAHIDIEKAPTVGHIWAFAGLDPTKKWEKHQKRPFNAALKRLCWIIGGSFTKNAHREGCVYGKVVQSRKQLEIQRNDAGLFADQAAKALKDKTWRKETEAFKSYSAGRLPPAHIQRRAERYATKLFLSHLHEVMYQDHYKCDPPNPYPIGILGHAHKVAGAS